jgi:hypothetical protein
LAKQFRPTATNEGGKNALLVRANKKHNEMVRMYRPASSSFHVVPAEQRNAAAVVVALDGSKQAIANKKKLREVVVKMAEQLGHYVEAASNDDPAVFTSSGFQTRSTTRVWSEQLAQPTIDHVDQGMTGELLVAVTAVAKGGGLHESRFQSQI